MSLLSKLFGNEPRPTRNANPIQLRAYERLTLLLERTTPEAIISRMENLTSLTPKEIEQQILLTLRLEFEHNITQQIYVSEELWEKIRVAQNQMTSFIISVSRQIPDHISGVEYAKALATAYHSNGDTPHEMALSYLKNEVKKLL